MNLPEFVNIRPDVLLKIDTPVVEMYAKFDHGAQLGADGKDAQAIGE